MQKLVLLFTLLFLTTPALTHAGEWETFYEKHPHVCTDYPDEKPLFTSFITYLHEWAGGVFVRSSKINFYEKLTDTQLGEWLENITLIAQTQKDPDAALEEIAIWYSSTLQRISIKFMDNGYDDVEAMKEFATLVQLEFQETAKLDTTQWITLTNYIFEKGRNTAARKESFKSLSRKTSLLPGSLTKLLTVFAKLENLSKWDQFLTTRTPAELNGLLEATQDEASLQKQIEIWGNVYTNFLSDLKDQPTMWGAGELFHGQFYPHTSESMFWIKHDQDAYYEGREVRVIYQPKVGPRTTVEGKITRTNYGTLEITNAKGKLFRLDQNDDHVYYFFVKEDLAFATNFNEYAQLLFKFYQVNDGEGGKACSLLMIQ